MPREIVLYQGKRFKYTIAFPWFLFIGWWVGLIVLTLAAFLTLTIIGIPKAFDLVDRIPSIVIRKESTTSIPAYESTGRRLLRAAYFLFIGSGLSCLMIIVALWINYMFGIFGGGIISDRMIAAVPSVATLSSS